MFNTNNLYTSLKSTINNKKFFLIAGPCVIENMDVMTETIESLLQTVKKYNIEFIFKASFQKANRSSYVSYSGVNIKEGLKILSKIKSKYHVPILTDIHEINQIKPAAEVVDIIQIPAFLSRQTFLLEAAAKSGKIINIKKGQFMPPEDIQFACDKITHMNNDKVLITERGTSFGYHNLVVDFRGFKIMSNTNFPVIYDVTHSLQLSSINGVTGGAPDFVPMMAKAAIATGYVNGLFIETHPNPHKALSDGASMLKLNEIDNLINSCYNIINA